MPHWTEARGPQSHWKRNGEPKVELSETEARALAERIQAEDIGSGLLMTFPRPYECPEGHHWHVGNMGPFAGATGPSTTLS